MGGYILFIEDCGQVGLLDFHYPEVAIIAALTADIRIAGGIIQALARSLRQPAPRVAPPGRGVGGKPVSRVTQQQEHAACMGVAACPHHRGAARSKAATDEGGYPKLRCQPLAHAATEALVEASSAYSASPDCAPRSLATMDLSRSSLDTRDSALR